MITVEQARRLRKAGALWVPSAGDRFVVPDRDMDDDVFVVSDMTVEVHDYPGGKVIGFNGTTEWALDSIAPPGGRGGLHRADLAESSPGAW